MWAGEMSQCPVLLISVSLCILKLKLSTLTLTHNKIGRLDANGGQQGGQRVHPHIVYLWHDAGRVRTCPSGYGHLATCDETDPKKQPPIGRLDANGGQISGFCGHTFHLISCTFGHFSCEIGGCFFGINKHDRHPARSRNDRSERGPHHAKGTRYVGELFGRPVAPH